MFFLAAVDICVVFFGILLYIWRLQFVFPDFALYLIAFLVLTFFVHCVCFSVLVFEFRGLVEGMKLLIGPTMILVGVSLIAGALAGVFDTWTWSADKAASGFRYFAWCLFQQFGLQSFFTNRLLTLFRRPNHVALISAVMFAVF